MTLLQAMSFLASIAPVVTLFGMLVFAALWLANPRKQKDEFAIRDAYLDMEMRKRYPLLKSKIVVKLNEVGNVDRIDRPSKD